MRNKHAGFTLAEVMVSLMIAVLLMLAAGSIFLFGNRSFLMYAAVLEDDQAGESIGRTIRNRLAFAEEIRVEERRPEDEEALFLMFSDEGRFYLDGEDVFGDAYYRNRKIGCSIGTVSDRGMQVEIWIEDTRGRRCYQGQQVIMLMNMRLSGGEISGQMEDGQEKADSAGRDLVIWYRKEAEAADE